MALAAVSTLTFGNHASTSMDCELLASATQAYRCLEMGLANAITQPAAAAWLLAKTNAIGISALSQLPLSFLDTGNTSVPGTVLNLSWITTPSMGSIFRRVSLPTTIGAGIAWTFLGTGFGVLKNAGLLLQNLVSNYETDVWWVVNE